MRGFFHTIYFRRNSECINHLKFAALAHLPHKNWAAIQFYAKNTDRFPDTIIVLCTNSISHKNSRQNGVYWTHRVYLKKIFQLMKNNLVPKRTSYLYVDEIYNLWIAWLEYGSHLDRADLLSKRKSKPNWPHLHLDVFYLWTGFSFRTCPSLDCPPALVFPRLYLDGFNLLHWIYNRIPSPSFWNFCMGIWWQIFNPGPHPPGLCPFMVYRWPFLWKAAFSASELSYRNKIVNFLRLPQLPFQNKRTRYRVLLFLYFLAHKNIYYK